MFGGLAVCGSSYFGIEMNNYNVPMELCPHCGETIVFIRASSGGRGSKVALNLKPVGYGNYYIKERKGELVAVRLESFGVQVAELTKIKTHVEHEVICLGEPQVRMIEADEPVLHKEVVIDVVEPGPVSGGGQLILL